MAISEVNDGDWYYEDTDKLTYDLADMLVEMYLLQAETRNVVKSKHILDAYGYSNTSHNARRVTSALKSRCDEYVGNGSVGASRFIIPDKYR